MFEWYSELLHAIPVFSGNADRSVQISELFG